MIRRLLKLRKAKNCPAPKYGVNFGSFHTSTLRQEFSPQKERSSSAAAGISYCSTCLCSRTKFAPTVLYSNIRWMKLRGTRPLCYESSTLRVHMQHMDVVLRSRLHATSQLARWKQSKRWRYRRHGSFLVTMCVFISETIPKYSQMTSPAPLASLMSTKQARRFHLFGGLESTKAFCAVQAAEGKSINIGIIPAAAFRVL